MIRKVFISPLVPTHFVKMDAVRLAKYNNPIQNESWLTEQRYSWSEEVIYVQKVQNSDKFTFEAWTNSAQTAGATLKLYNCESELIDTFSPTVAPLPNIYDGYDTQIRLMVSDFWELLDEDTYYFVLEIPFPDDSIIGFISEPQGLAELWEDTIYGEYRNSKNKDGVLFEGTNTTFGYRIEGSLKDNEQLIDRVVLNDQQNDTEPIYANAFDGLTLVLGTQETWVPDYAVRSWNNIFTCDATLIDGTEYTPASDGTAFEKQREDNYNLCVATIDLRFPDSQAVSKWSEGGLTIRANAKTYPYVLWSYQIRKGSFAAYSFYIPYYIYNDASLDDFIENQNTVRLPNGGMTGTAELEGDDLIYVLGIGENFDNITHVALTKYYDITEEAPAAANLNLQLSLLGKIGGLSKYALISPNNTLNHYGEIGNVLTGVTDSYVVASTATYTHRFFHDDTMHTVGHTGQYITTFSGSVPAELKWFNVQDSPSITAFNILTILGAAKASLEVLALFGNDNLDVISNYRSSLDNADRMEKLKIMMLTDNSLNVTGIDALYNNIVGTGLPLNVFPPPNGNIKTNLQTPTASPTAASASARSYLINSLFWSITS